MKQLTIFLLLLAMLVSLTACAQQAEAPGAEATATPAPADTTVPTPTVAPSATPLPTATATEVAATEAPATEAPPTEPPPTPTSSPTPLPVEPEPGTGVEIDEQEAVRILTPGNTSRVTSPVSVAGEADSTFEQTLVVRLVTIDGEQVALQPATIAADLGERGPFEVQVPFQVQEEQQAWIQVYSTSARDGGITHLSSVAVTLVPEGQADVVPATPQPERIVIDEPSTGDTVSGGVLSLSGRGLASFEQTLIAELLDDAGNVIAMQPLVVDAPDLGQPGTFEAELTYDVAQSTPARLQVRDPSPAFSGDVHLASVELTLEP